jgi:hypothetical protein
VARLCIREVAQARGLSQSQFQRNANLPMTTARRYWHGSHTGRAQDAGSLRCVNLRTLGRIANVLGVPPGDLVASTDDDVNHT